MSKFKKLIRSWAEQSAQSSEDPELVMHRHVEHAITNRFIVDTSIEKGMIALSFGKGKGDKATYSPHGFIMSVETSVDLIYKIRAMMLDAGHPDPFPPTVTVVGSAGGGPGGPGPQGNSGGGNGGPAVPHGWSRSGVVHMPDGNTSVTLVRGAERAAAEQIIAETVARVGLDKVRDVMRAAPIVNT